MGKNSTTKDNKLIEKKMQEPSLKTLDYLRMFARSYNPKIERVTKLGEVCVN